MTDIDIAAIEARHRRAPAPWESWHGHCITCDPPWPCDTRQVLDAFREAAHAAADAATEADMERAARLDAEHDLRAAEAERDRYDDLAKEDAEGRFAAEAREAKLRETGTAVLRAMDAVRDALNGLGHEGEPHDRVLEHPPVNGIQIRDMVGDCAACGGAQYGTEDDLQGAIGDLREALGEERKPWEYHREYASEAE